MARVAWRTLGPTTTSERKVERGDLKAPEEGDHGGTGPGPPPVSTCHYEVYRVGSRMEEEGRGDFSRCPFNSLPRPPLFRLSSPEVLSTVASLVCGGFSVLLVNPRVDLGTGRRRRNDPWVLFVLPLLLRLFPFSPSVSSTFFYRSRPGLPRPAPMPTRSSGNDRGWGRDRERLLSTGTGRGPVRGPGRRPSGGVVVEYRL